MNRNVLLTALFAAIGISCSGPNLSPEKTLALKQAQTRQFEVPYTTVWSSTLGYLQDNYYDIGQANKDGLILTASKIKSPKDPANELLWSNIKKGDFITLTISFDQIDETNTKVRLNVNTTRDKGAVGVPMGFGMTYTKSKVKADPITDPAVYKGFLDNLSREVQRRWMAQRMREEAKAKALAEAKADEEARHQADLKAQAEAEAKAKATAQAEAMRLAEARAQAAQKQIAEAQAQAYARGQADALAALEAEKASKKTTTTKKPVKPRNSVAPVK